MSIWTSRKGQAVDAAHQAVALGGLGAREAFQEIRHPAGDLLWNEYIGTYRRVRAVLLGGADRQHHGVHAAPGQRADLFPGQLMPAQHRQNTLSTSSCTGTMRTMFR